MKVLHDNSDKYAEVLSLIAQANVFINIIAYPGSDETDKAHNERFKELTKIKLAEALGLFTIISKE